MKFKILHAIIFYLLSFSGLIIAGDKILYSSEQLEIIQLTENSYIHISYLNTNDWGRVPCNGLVFINSGEAVVFDTPVDDSASAELINWIEHEKNSKVKAVVVNHFHWDCLGGLGTFHKMNAKSYSNAATIDYAKKDTVNNPVLPQNGFTDKLVLKIGDEEVINVYSGGGHTEDNIVSYIPSEKVLFGGCLIKAIGVGKGNLEDANVKEWSSTVAKIKEQFPEIKYVVPGHGDYGDTELLNYTIKMFENEK